MNIFFSLDHRHLSLELVRIIIDYNFFKIFNAITYLMYSNLKTLVKLKQLISVNHKFDGLTTHFF